MSMQSPYPDVPPEVTGAGMLAVILGAIKFIADLFRVRAEHRKISAEAETAEVLGQKTYEELHGQHLEHLARFLKDMQLRQDDLASRLEESEAHNLAFRSAVLKFIGVVVSVLPKIPDVARTELQTALDHLRTDKAWNR